MAIVGEGLKSIHAENTITSEGRSDDVGWRRRRKKTYSHPTLSYSAESPTARPARLSGLFSLYVLEGSDRIRIAWKQMRMKEKRVISDDGSERLAEPWLKHARVCPPAMPSHSSGRLCAISAPVNPACVETATRALAEWRRERSWSRYK